MILIALLLTAACSDPVPQDTPANQSSTIQETALPPSSAAPPPDTSKPGTIETFRDWVVGCDNGLDCKATVLGPEAGDFPRLLMSVERKAGPLGALRIGFTGQEDATPPIAVTIDGKVVASGGTTSPQGTYLTGADAQRVAAAMVEGKQATVRSGATSQALSLAGASAALRYIDDKQGRAGTQSALVARGPAPATIPRAPALPIVRVPAIGGTAAALTPELLASMREQGSCETYDDEYGRSETAALSDTLTVVTLPCSRGAYNAMSAVFLVEDGTARPADFDVKTTMGPDDIGVGVITNGGFENGLLGSYAKGRGLGDCGVIQTFAWDGTGFRLVEMSEMPECRGSTDYIPTFRAQVVRESAD